MLHRNLTETATTFLEQLMIEQETQIIKFMTSSLSFIPDLIDAIQKKDTRNDAIMMLVQVCQAMNKTNVQTRVIRQPAFVNNALYGTFFFKLCENTAVFNIFGEELAVTTATKKDATMTIRSSICKILNTMSKYQSGTLLREAICRQSHPLPCSMTDSINKKKHALPHWKPDSSVLWGLVLCFLTDETHREEAFVVLKQLIETMDAKSDKFISIFHAQYIGWLVHPLLYNQSVNPSAGPSPSISNVQLNESIMNLITPTIKPHEYKTRYFLQRYKFFDTLNAVLKQEQCSVFMIIGK